MDEAVSPGLSLLNTSENITANRRNMDNSKIKQVKTKAPGAAASGALLCLPEITILLSKGVKKAEKRGKNRGMAKNVKKHPFLPPSKVSKIRVFARFS